MGTSHRIKFNCAIRLEYIESDSSPYNARLCVLEPATLEPIPRSAVYGANCTEPNAPIYYDWADPDHLGLAHPCLSPFMDSIAAILQKALVPSSIPLSYWAERTEHAFPDNSSKELGRSDAEKQMYTEQYEVMIPEMKPVYAGTFIWHYYKPVIGVHHWIQHGRPEQEVELLAVRYFLFKRWIWYLEDNGICKFSESTLCHFAED